MARANGQGYLYGTDIIDTEIFAQVNARINSLADKIVEVGERNFGGGSNNRETFRYLIINEINDWLLRWERHPTAQPELEKLRDITNGFLDRIVNSSGFLWGLREEFAECIRAELGNKPQNPKTFTTRLRQLKKRVEKMFVKDTLAVNIDNISTCILGLDNMCDVDGMHELTAALDAAGARLMKMSTDLKLKTYTREMAIMSSYRLEDACTQFGLDPEIIKVPRLIKKEKNKAEDSSDA